MRHLRTASALLLLTGCAVQDPSIDDGLGSTDRRAALAEPAAPAADRQFVLDRLLVPATASEAVKFGLDLDGDGNVDNALGNVLSALGQAGPDLDLRGSVDRAIDRGETIQLVHLRTSDAAAGLWWRGGADPAPRPCTGPDDAVCRGHLGGDGRFAVDGALSATPDLAVTVTGERLATAPGALHIDVPLGGAPLPLDLVSARVRARVAGATLADGAVGGAIRGEEIDRTITPMIAASVAATVERSCTPVETSCGCAPGSTGATLLALFDRAPRDCAVSFEEVRSSAIVRSLLTPDVDLDGDGSADALSVGFGLHAVAAGFPAPPTE